MGKSASEVRSEIEGTRQDMSETIDAIADRTSPGRIIQRRRQRVSDGWRSVRERVMGRSEDTYGSAGDAAQGVGGTARDAAGSVVEGARRAPDKVIEQTQGNPIAAGLIAFGGGLLVASLIPPSEAEQRVAGQVVEKAQPVRDELQRAGQEVVEDLRSTAEQGAEQVKQRATEAAGTVQEDVRASAGNVTEEAQR
jgi:cell division septum initiation protein DivIVA